jgi:hypothetical protein
MATKRATHKDGPVTQSQFQDGIASLRGEMGALGTELRGEMGTLGTELRGEISTLGTELRDEMVTLRTELRDEIRGVGVMVERIDSNVRALAEALVSTRDELKRDISELDARLSERIGIIESVVRQNSVEIQKNSTDLRALTAEVARLRHDFEHRPERAQLASLEERVTALELRAGIRR